MCIRYWFGLVKTVGTKCAKHLSTDFRKEDEEEDVDVDEEEESIDCRLGTDMPTSKSLFSVICRM